MGLVREESNTHKKVKVKRSNKYGCKSHAAAERRKAALIPNYIRIKATAECYNSNLGTKRRGRKKVIPGLGKASLVVPSRRDDDTPSHRRRPVEHREKVERC